MSNPRLERFLASPEWAALLSTLQLRVEDHKETLSKKLLDSPSAIRDLGRLQGRISAYETFLDGSLARELMDNHE